MRLNIAKFVVFMAFSAAVLVVAFLVWQNFSSSVKNIPTNADKSDNREGLPKPGGCLILPQEFCSQTKLVDFTERGQPNKAAVFNLPVGTPIFSPVNGQLVKALVEEDEESALQGPHGLILSITDPEQTTIILAGDIKFLNDFSQDVTVGDLVGEIQDSGVKNLGDNNLIFFPVRVPKNGETPPLTDESLLESLFKSL